MNHELTKPYLKESRAAKSTLLSSGSERGFISAPSSSAAIDGGELQPTAESKTLDSRLIRRDLPCFCRTLDTFAQACISCNEWSVQK